MRCGSEGGIGLTLIKLSSQIEAFTPQACLGGLSFPGKGELYFWQVNFMEVLPRLVRFLWLSNCPQKHSLLWETGEKLIAIEDKKRREKKEKKKKKHNLLWEIEEKLIAIWDTQSQWREEKVARFLMRPRFATRKGSYNICICSTKSWSGSGSHIPLHQSFIHVAFMDLKTH